MRKKKIHAKKRKRKKETRSTRVERETMFPTIQCIKCTYLLY